MTGANSQTQNMQRQQGEKAIRVIKFMLFSATIVPSLVALSMAYNTEGFRFLYFALGFLGLFIGQAGGDYLYYYFTHRHSDPRDSHTKIFAGWRPFFTKNLPKKHGTLYGGIFCLLIDLLIAFYFYSIYGYYILLLGLAGGLIAIFFTPLMLKGLKEPVIFVTFGPLCIAGLYYVLTGEFSITPLLVSLPIGFFVTVVAYLKGAKVGVKTSNNNEFVIKLNNRAIIILFTLAYISIVLFSILSLIPMLCLTSLITIPIAWSVIKVVKLEGSSIEDYLWAVVRSIMVLLLAGLFISLGFII